MNKIHEINRLFINFTLIPRNYTKTFINNKYSFITLQIVGGQDTMEEEDKNESLQNELAERARTNIQGFDNLISGGFPRSFNILLTGGPGTGKTIFGMQYLFNGATKYGEVGLFVSFEQSGDKLKRQAAQFEWNLDALEKTGEVHIMHIPARQINKKTVQKIKNYAQKYSIKRIVIDSLSTLVINAPIYSTLSELNMMEKVSGKTYVSPPIIGEQIINRFLYSFIDELKEIDSTNILIAEASQAKRNNEEILSGEYACDGVIKLSFESIGGDYSRSMIIRKMRETKNDENIHPVEIGKNGIVIHKPR